MPLILITMMMTMQEMRRMIEMAKIKIQRMVILSSTMTILIIGIDTTMITIVEVVRLMVMRWIITASIEMKIVM